MNEFKGIFDDLLKRIMVDGEEVEVGEWQSQDVRDKPHMISRELRHVAVVYPLPSTPALLQEDVKPNLPWSEDHFQERVSGIPYNPPPSEEYWPYAVKNNEAFKKGGAFSHTYPERFWPKEAGDLGEYRDGSRVNHNFGIRYLYGDLEDVVNLLSRNSLTRQAYLPVWFPEDTGAVGGQRVPCTLGYHFLIRGGQCEIVYYIRSCDLLRHFTDDLYMACRLLQWVVGKLLGNGIDVKASSLIMHISSLHIFRGDYERVEWMIENNREQEGDSYGAAI